MNYILSIFFNFWAFYLMITILKLFILMKFNYSKKQGSESKSNDSLRDRAKRKRQRSSSSKKEGSYSRSRTPHKRGYRQNSRHRKTHKNYSREKLNQARSRREQPRYHNNKKRSSSHSSSSSSSSSSSQSSSSSSMSSSTRKRRTTPHYKFKIGEKLGHKYKVTRLLGTGTFGRVLEAKYKDEQFALKIIKPVQKYVDSAKTERSIVKTLNEADPQGRHHIVKFIETFYHHQYYCMVFQPLGPSLYDVIKKNNHLGYPLRLVQAFSRQLFEAVGYMHSLNYTHTDLKPENILFRHGESEKVGHSKLSTYELPSTEQVKLIDFGGATHKSQRHSSTINTRQYRSPEVILQCCDWKQSSDVWSIGCIIPELFTGNLLFPTHDDLEHLLMIIKNYPAKMPNWMLKKCKNELSKYFKGDEVDERLANKRIRHWEDIVGLKKVDQILADCPQLSSLVTLCLQVDPNKRISCSQALKHPFFDLKI